MSAVAAMPIGRKPLLAALLLLVASVASAATSILPGLARADGLGGARFVSTLWVTNLGVATEDFEFVLMPRGGTPLAPVVVPIEGGRTLEVVDPIGELFGLDGIAGTILVRAESLFLARAATANVAAEDRTTGFGMSGVDLRDALAAGETGHSPGLARSRDASRGTRSNVGVVLLDPGSSVLVELFDGDGSRIGRRIVESPLPTSWQAAAESIAGDREIAAGRVAFTVVTGCALGYVAAVDNPTGDGSYFPAERLADGGTDRIVSGVARSSGLGGVRWTSDLLAANPGSAAAQLTVELLGTTGGGRLLSRTVPAGGAVEIADLLGPAGLDLPDGTAGAARVRSQRSLVVAGRTSAVAPDDPNGRLGRASTRLRAADRNRDLAAPARRWVLAGLRSGRVAGVAWRTNVALAAGPSGARGQLVLRDGGGIELGRAAFTLGADAWWQKRAEEWLAGFRVPTTFRIDLELSEGKVEAYASVIDEGSGDPVVVSAARGTVDPGSLERRSLTGYQGWFATPSDGSSLGWSHWFRGQIPDAAHLTVDLWPNVSELDADELEPTRLRMPDGSPAKLFSSHRAKTVDRHFRWMSDHELDGVFLQRFTIDLGSEDSIAFHDQVATNVRRGAERHGRIFAVMYDVTGDFGSDLVDRIASDWKRLVGTLHLPSSPAYLREGGLPVVGVWGAGFADRPGSAADFARLLDFFQRNSDGRWRAKVVGGVPAGWRTLTRGSKSDPAWSAVFRRFDALSPWLVGQSWDFASVDAWASTEGRADLAETRALGIRWIPVIFPGFSWHNATGAPLEGIPRRAGKFLWRQAWDFLGLGATSLYVAMFDEVDEGTAIFEVAESQAQQPTGCELVPLDSGGWPVPSDWYLRLTGEAGRILRGEAPLLEEMPAP
jgi:hypothetical protein